MFNLRELEIKYSNDVAFNKMVNLMASLMREYEFQASEVRQAAFLAQYRFNISKANEVLMTEADREKFIDSMVALRQSFANSKIGSEI